MKVFRTIIDLTLLGLSALFGYLYYAHYFKWKNCFGTSGRCFDSQTGVVYHEQSGLVWLPLTILTTSLLIYRVWRAVR